MKQKSNPSYPWVVAMQTPIKVVDLARFLNRQDAERHLQFLRRYVIDQAFILMFDLDGAK